MFNVQGALSLLLYCIYLLINFLQINPRLQLREKTDYFWMLNKSISLTLGILFSAPYEFKCTHHKFSFLNFQAWPYSNVWFLWLHICHAVQGKHEQSCPSAASQERIKGTFPMLFVKIGQFIWSKSKPGQQQIIQRITVTFK